MGLELLKTGSLKSTFCLLSSDNISELSILPLRWVLVRMAIPKSKANC